VNGKSLKNFCGRWVESCNQPGKPVRGDLPDRRGPASVSGFGGEVARAFRIGRRVHAFVLIDNQYHLVVRTIYVSVRYC
jgi:hypothetical protein